MQQLVRRTIQQYQLMPPGCRVVVGVSGGADSLALMYVLAKLQTRLQIQLHIASLDHGWRGKQGASDVAFVRKQAITLGLAFTGGSVSLPGHHEALARRARYQFLAEVAGQVGASRVAVAHHADDQAETILMRLLRGAGLHGLGGMRPYRPLPGHAHLTLVRPMLDVTRRQVEAYCHEHELVPRTDPSNQDTTFLRNRIRLELLPQLATANPNIAASLSRLAEVAAVESDYLEQQANKLMGRALQTTPAGFRLPRETFTMWHMALQRRIVYTLARRLTPQGDVDYQHIVHAVYLANTGDTGAVAQLPGAHMRLTPQYLVFETQDQAYPPPPIALHPTAQHKVQPGLPVRLIGGTFTLAPAADDIPGALGYGYFPATQGLLRGRATGDRILPPGMAGKSQKLSDWMINRKIPAHQRDYLPLLIFDGHIAAVLHATAGVITHPFHRVSAGRTRRFALHWQPLA